MTEGCRFHITEEKIAYYMRTPAWCQQVAEQVGPACVEVIAALNEQGVMFKLRQAQGILGLRERHDASRLEAACRKAIEAGDPSYRTIKGILALGIEDERASHPRGDGGAAAFLHGPEQLFALPARQNTAENNVVSMLPKAAVISLEMTNTPEAGS